MLVRIALRRALTQVHHVAPVRFGRAQGVVATVYRQLERDFGLVAPPVALHSPSPEPMVAAWMMLRETLVAAGAVDRATKEAVASAVSVGNSCPYCVQVHDATLDGLVSGAHADPPRQEIGAWTLACATREEAAAGVLPFPAEHAPEIVGTALTFQYLNRMVNIYLDKSPLPPNVPASARDRAQRMLGRFMRPAASRTPTPGAATDLLPAAPLPDDLKWAAGSPTIADALARASAAIDEAGRRSVPEPVRGLVERALATWDGRPTGLSRGWVVDATAGLPPADRPAGTLALLTAMASYQVDQSVVDEFRNRLPGGRDDAALIDLTSWASLTAARQVVGWMPTDQATQGGAAIVD